MEDFLTQCARQEKKAATVVMKTFRFNFSQRSCGPATGPSGPQPSALAWRLPGSQDSASLRSQLHTLAHTFDEGEESADGMDAWSSETTRLMKLESNPDGERRKRGKEGKQDAARVPLKQHLAGPFARTSLAH